MHSLIGLVSTNIDAVGILRISGSSLYILGKINNYRPRLSRPGNIESFFDDTSKIISVSYRNTVLGNVSGDAYGIDLLKRIISDKPQRYLSRKTYERYAVQKRICKSGNGIGCPRSAGHKTHGSLSGGTGITFCLMYQSLLMSGQHYSDGSILAKLVEEIRHHSARIGKYGIYIFVFQGFYEQFSSGDIHSIFSCT